MQAKLFYKPKVLQIGQLKDACEAAFGTVLGQDCKIEVNHPRSLSPGVTDELRLGVESLRPIVDLDDVEFVICGSGKNAHYSRTLLIFERAVEGKSFSVFAADEKAFRCMEMIAKSLGLEQTERPMGPFEAFEMRIATLEKAVNDAGNSPKCFISFKFDDPDTLAQVNRLKRFLAAAHIEFLTGEQFEPRRIEDKVKAKLRADVDFLIAVINKAGESKFVRDEIADANSRGIWIVILLEEGAPFDEGILGHLEYVRYTVAIEQTFPEVLEAINFVRADVSRRSSGGS